MSAGLFLGVRNSSFDFKTRSNEAEHLDRAEFRGVELAQALADIGTFNRWLGGQNSLIKAVTHAVERLPNRGSLRLVDIGCGSGDGLRALARWARARGLGLELYGLDANSHVIEIARSQSLHEPAIQFVVGDAFGSTLQELSPDIVVANQFFHHFTCAELQTHLPALLQRTRALVMCDLHRHPVAHEGFGLLARLWGASRIARHDGLVSIRRGFTRHELEAMTARLPLSYSAVVWRWPFRFEVVMLP